MAELYSANKLTNGGAETGNTTGWTTSGVTVVTGGTEGIKCFNLAADANMSQTVNSGGIQPPDIKASFTFLPEFEPTEGDPKIYARVAVEHEYADGSADSFTIPCRADAGV